MAKNYISKSDYLEVLETFRKLVEAALTVSSLSEKVQTTSIGIESTKGFTRICVNAMSIQSLFPENEMNASKWWDFSSISVLTQALMGVCHRYLYLSEQGLSSSESDFRLALYYHHLNTEKYKFYKGPGVPLGATKQLEINLAKDKAKLVEFEIFKSLENRSADDVRNGKVCMHLTDEETSERYELLNDEFKTMYRILSNHAHGPYFAKSSQSDKRGRGIENEVEIYYMWLSLQILNRYLSKAVLNQIELLNLKAHAVDEDKYCLCVFRGDSTI